MGDTHRETSLLMFLDNDMIDRWSFVLETPNCNTSVWIFVIENGWVDT